MAESPKYANNELRVKNEAEIDAVINAWTAQHASTEILEKLKRKETSVPSGEGVYESPLCSLPTSHWICSFVFAAEMIILSVHIWKECFQEAPTT